MAKRKTIWNMIRLHMIITVINRTFCTLEKGTEENAAHSDGFGNSRNPSKDSLLAAWLYLLANSNYFRLTCTFQQFYDTFFS